MLLYSHKESIIGISITKRRTNDMSSIKTITSALAGVLALTTIVSAETTVTLPDVNASIYGKLNYSAYYNEDLSLIHI